MATHGPSSVSPLRTMSSSVPPKRSDGASVHLVSWIIYGFGLLLCTQYVLREWLAAYAPPTAELVVGLLLLLVTVPSARIKRFQIAKFVVEFHADRPPRRR